MGIWWGMEGDGDASNRVSPKRGCARAGAGAGVRLHGPGLDEMLVRLR